MAALTVVDEAGMEVMPFCPRTVAEVMVVDLMALVAGRSVVAMTGIAVAGPESVGMSLMQLTARSVLETGVTGGTFTKGFTQRTAGDAGDMAALTVIDEAGMEIVPLGARSITVVMAVDLMALVAGRGVVAMTDGAVAGPKVVGMLLVQRAARSVLEAGMTGGAFTERLA